eukprot:TRINITY_DN4454_c0_g2_i1.p6 TRINITY_DN4454_c0_g2~~TRINITY_DN4454_c0_g2_i1.p6  ORF type:complete len:159 (+),score=24.38 TRINITY_DN4454_c0_g2_i1:1365-1841(+)
MSMAKLKFQMLWKKRLNDIEIQLWHMIDSDLIPETNVLKNKLGITDQTLLDQAEADITQKGFSLNSKLLRDKAAYVRDALVLYRKSVVKPLALAMGIQDVHSVVLYEGQLYNQYMEKKKKKKKKKKNTDPIKHQKQPKKNQLKKKLSTQPTTKQQIQL